MRPIWGRIAVAATAAVTFVCIGLYYCIGAGVDDPFMTYWSALQLAQGKGLVNYNYVPCETSSSLLHVVCLAICYKVLSIDMYVIGKFFGVAVGVVCFIVGASASKSLEMAAYYCLLLLANLSFMYWCFGGLETSLAALTFLLYCLAVVKALETKKVWFAPTLIGCLVMLARPEGFIVICTSGVLLCAILLFLGKRPTVQMTVHFLLLSCAFVTLGLARMAAFGNFWPTPVLAKAQLSVSTVCSGWDYLSTFVRNQWFLTANAFFLLLFLYDFVKRVAIARIFDPVYAVLLSVIVSWVCFVVFAGGDWMAHGRFFAPIMPLLAFTLARATTIVTCARSSLFRVGCILCALMLPVVCYGMLDGRFGIRNPALWNIGSVEELMMLNGAQRRDLMRLMPYIRDQFLRDLSDAEGAPVVLSGQAGFFPYMLRTLHPSKRFVFLDTYGLVEPELARLEGPRTGFGLKHNGGLVGVLKGRSGNVSRYVLRQGKPAIVYWLHKVRQQFIEEVKRLGYEVTWLREPDTVVFRLNRRQQSAVPPGKALLRGGTIGMRCSAPARAAKPGLPKDAPLHSSSQAEQAPPGSR